MGNYNELCHYEMKDRARALYAREHTIPESEVCTYVVTDFSDNGHIECIHNTRLYPDKDYSFADLTADDRAAEVTRKAASMDGTRAYLNNTIAILDSLYSECTQRPLTTAERSRVYDARQLLARLLEYPEVLTAFDDTYRNK